MATARQEEFEEEFLTCSICINAYNEENNRAKVLPCLHTFCKFCLVKHAQGQPKIDCPKCRCKVTMPSGGVDKLPNNFIVENLKEYRDIFKSSVACGSCSDKEKHAEMFCHNCGCFMCGHCVDAHKQLGPVSEHVLVSIAELQKKLQNPMMHQLKQCKKHPKQDLTLYCKNTYCEVLVCASCCLIDHRGHHLVELAAATDEIKADLRQSLQKVQRRSRELAQKRATTENLQKHLTDDLKQHTIGMQHECEQELVKLIKDQFSKADHNFNQLYELETKDLQDRLASLDSLTAQMISACDYASKACEMSNPAQLLDSRNQIKERLSELENIRLPKTVEAYTINFNFTDKHYLALKQIQGALPHLCYVSKTAKSSTWQWLYSKLVEVLPYLARVGLLIVPFILIILYRALEDDDDDDNEYYDFTYQDDYDFDD